jgi:uncharacterized protein
MKYRARFLLSILVLLVVTIVCSKPLAHLLTEMWWFDGMGFGEVFWKRFWWQALLWVGTFSSYAIFLLGNYWLAIRRTQRYPFRFSDDSALERVSEGTIHTAVTGFTLLGSIAAAGISMGAWEVVLNFLNGTAVGKTDPILQQDLAVYLFKLPFYEMLALWLLAPIVFALILAIVVYLLKGVIDADQHGSIQIQAAAKPHLSLLLSLVFLLLGWYFWLGRYQLLYDPGGVVFGVGYTDRYARLIAYQITSLIAVIVAVLLLLGMRRRNFNLEFKGIGILIAAIVLLQGGLPWVMQQFIVGPNELTKEKAFLAHNIKFTQDAYKLDDIQQEKYQATAQLTQQSLANNQSTIQNIRLWDYRPLLSTYRQLQEIRLYYKFHDVDIDRYTLNGNYQQVMLSAREMAIGKLPKEAQTWVNQHLKYTHGYGFVMSPVNQITSDGLPEFHVKNIPPAATVDLKIEQPAIYYGEETNNYIFTGMTTDEFDYPVGDTNASNRYQGKGGVSLKSFWQRLVYAYDLNSLQILISNYFAPTSRIHYYRQIQSRVSHIAPFLKFDHDPYLVVADGRLQWIIDAYTTSNHYPYAKAIAPLKAEENGLGKAGTQFLNNSSLTQSSLNYIRNSVKVLVDAYDGTVRLFAIDESEPILATYRKIFPNLFETGPVPETIQAHFRYPQDLFKIQMQLYLTYHMSDPEVFYNREDQWQLPRQIYEDTEVLLEPYYVIMRLPGEKQPEFLMIQPFTPANKENMIAWVAARSNYKPNGQGQGKLLLYEFPKQSLVYGPRQLESRIDQDSQISPQFTLWNQSGSKVIRGDLFVIPIDQSLLYVEPIYLRADQSELPQLKRVIVAYDKSIAMEPTLEASLAKIFGEPEKQPDRSKQPTAKSEKPAKLSPAQIKLGRSALEIYRKAQAALKQGNWTDYGRYQQELEKLLQQMEQ